MWQSTAFTRCVKTTAEARDQAQFLLGALSLAIWFAVAFTLGVRWYIDENNPQPILMAGGIALMICAIPWLAYPWLVRRLAHGTDSR